jgi:phosphatidate cytidylyltransferase
LWTGAFDSRPLGADPSEPWDPPVVPTAPPGRFEELVAAAARAEADARAQADANGGAPPPTPAPAPVASPPEPELRQVTPDRPLTSDPVSGEWAVASGLGGGIGPARARRSLPTPESGPAPASSDWDRLTGPASGRGQVGERGSWDFFDEPADHETEEPAGAAAGAAGDPSTMSLPHWTEPATGEVPRILAGDPPPAPPEADEELSAWSALSTGPRWRDQPADWDEADFSDTVLDDREARLGALRDQPEPEDDRDIFAFDDAAAAVAAPPVAASTPATARSRGTATQVRPAGRARPARGAAATRNGPGGPGGSAGGRGGGGSGGGGGSDLTTRVITGVIAAGVLLAATAIGSRALVVVVLAAVTMAAAELFQGLRTRGYQPATLLGLVATASMVLATYIKGEPAFPLVLSLLVIFSFLWYLAGVVHAKPTMNIAVTVFAFLYVGFLGSYACLFLRIHDGQGIGLLIGAVIATAAHDIGAYLVGKYMGKTPLAPELSPNKTFEGLVGGVLASVFVSLIVVGQIGPWSPIKAFWLGVVVAVTAPLGDLCESMIKRDLGVKDMGKLLPGHGGVLDRIDALLFVIPATYYLVLLLF